jgi:hypothetical protein
VRVEHENKQQEAAEKRKERREKTGRRQERISDVIEDSDE